MSTAELAAVSALEEISAPASSTALRRALDVGVTRLGLALIALTLVVAAFGPLVAPHGPTELLAGPFSPPGDGLMLGADVLGRDVLSRVLWGGRNLVWMSVLAASLGVGLGTAIGVSAAYFKGRTDTTLMRSVDVLLSFPSIVVVLLFVSVFGPKPWLLVLVVGLSQAPSVARVMRGAALPVVEQDYVKWCEAGGMGAKRLLVREVLPNITSPLFVEISLRLMWCISLIAGLSFLGYGLQPPAADWGLMVNENRNGLGSQPWAVVVPILAIAVFTFGGGLVAEGISRAIGRTNKERT